MRYTLILLLSLRGTGGGLARHFVVGSATPPRANRNATANASAWGGGRARTPTSFWGPAPLAPLQPGIEDANDLCPSLLPPGPPLFIFGFIPACLSGVGLKGAGWTRTENDISTRTT